MEVKWNNPRTEDFSNPRFKDYCTFYSGQDEVPVQDGSDRERILQFLNRQLEALKDANVGEHIKINAEKEFPEDLYKPVETLMAFLLSKRYKTSINYFSNPPEISVEKGKEEQQMEHNNVNPSR